MKTDAQIQQDVMAELKWEPFLIAHEIGVTVKDGVVTLSGQVDSYSKKLMAEKAAKKVSGVKAIAEDIQIGVSKTNVKSDTEIAAAIVNALKWHTPLMKEQIKVKVEDGYVKLEGEVEWEFQRINAKTAIENIAGVRSVANLIVVKPKLEAKDIMRDSAAKPPALAAPSVADFTMRSASVAGCSTPARTSSASIAFVGSVNCVPKVAFTALTIGSPANAVRVPAVKPAKAPAGPPTAKPPRVPAAGSAKGPVTAPASPPAVVPRGPTGAGVIAAAGAGAGAGVISCSGAGAPYIAPRCPKRC